MHSCWGAGLKVLAACDECTGVQRSRESTDLEMEHANRSDKWVLWVKVFLGGGEEWVKDIKVGVCYTYGEVQES